MFAELPQRGRRNEKTAGASRRGIAFMGGRGKVQSWRGPEFVLAMHVGGSSFVSKLTGVVRMLCMPPARLFNLAKFRNVVAI
jgi:hypothetical protein